MGDIERIAAKDYLDIVAIGLNELGANLGKHGKSTIPLREMLSAVSKSYLPEATHKKLHDLPASAELNKLLLNDD